MELLAFLLLASCVLVVLIKPEKERLAFSLFVLGSVVCFAMFAVASWTSFLPYAAY